MTDSRRTRLAIAMVALRYKPAAQTCASYALDLQRKFPPRVCHRDTPSKDIPESPECWRRRVLELEAELRETQERLRIEEIELAVLRSGPTPASTAAPASTPVCPNPTPIAGKKKKSKRVAAPQTSAPSPVKAPRPRLKEILHDKSELPELSSHTKLLSTFQALETLVEAMTNNPSAASIEALRLAAEHALDSLAGILTSVLSPTAPTPTSSAVLETLSQLTTHHLDSVVPLLATVSRKKDAQRYADALDALLGQLATRVLTPLTRSFSALSASHISALFTISKKGRQRRAPFDIRPDAFGFLRTVIDSLQALCASSPNNDILIVGVQSVCEALALSAVRELEAIFSPPAPPGVLDDNGSFPVRSVASGAVLSPRPPQQQLDDFTRIAIPPAPRAPPPTTDRVQKLAQKEALWYLCALLQHTIPRATISAGARPANSSGTAPNSDVLRAGIGTVLAGLLRKTARPSGFHVPGHDGRGQGRGCNPVEQNPRWLLGEVEREMLLAVAENLWLSQG